MPHEPTPSARPVEDGFATAPNPFQKKERDVRGRVDAATDFKFHLAHRVGDWIVDVEGNLIPDLRRIAHAPGVNATNRQDNFLGTAVQHQNAGFVFVPRDALGPGSDYMRVFVNKKGKPVHRTVFEKPIRRQSGRTKFRTDRESWRDFCFLLRDGTHSGFKLEAPRPEHIEGLLVAARKKRAALRAPSTEDPAKRAEYALRCEIVEKQLATLERESSIAIDIYGEMQSVEVTADEAVAGLSSIREKRLRAEGKLPSLEDEARARRLEDERRRVAALEEEEERKHAERAKLEEKKRLAAEKKRAAAAKKGATGPAKDPPPPPA